MCALKNQPHSSDVSVMDKVEYTQKCNYQKLLNFSLDVICSVDKEGRFLDVSAACKTVWGYCPEELKGRPYIDFVVAEDRQRTLEVAAQIMKGTSFTNFENHYTCKNGNIKPVIWSAQWNPVDEIMYCVARDGTEKKAAEQREKEYQQRLYKAYKSAQIGWWEWNVESSEYVSSDELYNIYGITRADFPAITRDVFISLVHPDEVEQLQKNLLRIAEYTDEFQFEHRLVKPEGAIIHVCQQVRIVRDKTGKLIQIHGTAKDITEMKKAELALKESEQRLCNIFESIGDGFIALDKNWMITYWNCKAEEVLGLKREEALNRNIWEVYIDDESRKFYTQYHKAMQENIPVHFEEYYPALNIWFDISAYPSKDGLSVYFRNITERKKNDAKLKQAENELVTVLENMTDGFFVVDKAWTITYATEKIAAMLGINKRDYIGKNLWHCFPGAIGTKFYIEYHRAFAEGSFVSFEEYLPGFKLWFEVNAYPNGDFLSIYIKDITQRKTDEKRLEFIARATTEVIWERNWNSDEVFINAEKFKRVFGYEIKDNRIRRSFWLNKVHPDDIARVDQTKHHASANGLDFFRNEYRFKKADGSWAYVKERVYLIRDEEQKPYSLVGTMQDVTDKRLAENALRESEETYKQLFDHASLPKIIYDKKTLHILKVNEAAVEHYGYSEEEFCSMILLDIRPAEDRDKVLQLITELNLSSRANMGVWTHLKKGGEKILVDISMSIINYKGKKAYLSTILDITEKQKLQKDLIKEKIRQQKLITKVTIEAQEKERTDIGKELHDNVNQLLTAAKLYIENINYFPEQKQAFIEKSVSLIQKSINEIRVLSKALVTPTINDIGFNEALSEMIECYQELNLFEIDYNNNICPKKVEKDIRLTIYRIIQEQLNNIIKYAKASHVKVHILMERQQLFVLIKDNGVGFDPDARKKGIGLNNIKNRTELFKGKMEIESEKGKGCKMEVCFPLK
jgi:PAS domain S-box-containing protein